MNSMTRLDGVARRTPTSLGIWMLWALWGLVRFPVLALLMLLEPLVRFSLAGVALVLTLTTAFWYLAAPAGVHVPVLGLLAGAVGCIGILRVYQFLLALLAD